MTVFLFRLVGFICLMAATRAAAQIIIPDSLQATGKIAQGYREGLWKFYAKSDQKIYIEGSYRRGLPDGKWFWYAANRRIFFEQTYRKGLAEGWGRWYAGGKLVREQWFGKGVADSAFAYYNSAGHYALRGMTDKNRPRGMWQVYFPDGKLAAEWHWFRRGAYHGASQWFYPSGQIFAKGNFVTALAEGRWEFRAPDDSWQMIGHFKDDLPHGVWEISHAGQLLYRLSFKDGQLHGQHLRYDDTGAVVEKIIYDSGRLERLEEKGRALIDSGKGERIFKDWQGKIIAKGSYQNGLLEDNVLYFSDLQEVLTQNYRKGQPDGTFELHMHKGELLMRGNYRNGQIDSLCLFFYPSGSLQAQGEVKNGLQEGEWQFFYPNKNLKAQGAYKSGIAEGLWTYYDAQGQKSAQGTLQAGCPSGEWLFYHNGKLIAKGNFENGLRQGAWTDYFPNGSLRAQGSYDRDREHGEWRYFHSNGRERQREQWQDGKLLEISDFVAPNGRSLPKGSFKKGNGSRLIYHEKRRFWGKWQVSVRGNYKDGLPEGRWRYYDRKGRLQKERIFAQGKSKSDD